MVQREGVKLCVRRSVCIIDCIVCVFAHACVCMLCVVHPNRYHYRHSILYCSHWMIHLQGHQHGSRIRQCSPLVIHHQAKTCLQTVAEHVLPISSTVQVQLLQNLYVKSLTTDSINTLLFSLLGTRLRFISQWYGGNLTTSCLQPLPFRHFGVGLMMAYRSCLGRSHDIQSHG